MHVHEKGATGDDLLPATAGQQTTALSVFCDRPGHRNRRCACQDPTNGCNRSRARLPQDKGVRRRLLLHDPDANRLQLKLTHPADLSDAISALGKKSRNLRLYAPASAFS